MRDVGGDVALAVRGTVRPLPDSVEVCGFRIVQESLTNAGRHAPGSRVRVVLDYGEDALLIVVENGGARRAVMAGAAVATPGTGGFGWSACVNASRCSTDGSRRVRTRSVDSP